MQPALIPDADSHLRCILSQLTGSAILASILVLASSIAIADNHDDNAIREKIALIVAISEYDDNGWRAIHSTNDIPIIKESLGAHGFTEDNIFVVKDHQATRDGIYEAIENTLLPRIGKGDVVYFHFSGHGQRIRDDNCDESDGFDESLVPHDAPVRGSQSYAGELHIRDDEVEQIVDSLRLAAGPTGDVVVALDSCFSGTAARGLAPVRGGETPVGTAQQCANRLDEAKIAIKKSDNPAMSGFVVLAASQFNELARETQLDTGEYVGSLSFALSKALPEATTESTYRHLFTKIKRKMAAVVRNNPQLDGDANRRLFGGLAVTQESFYEVVLTRGQFVRIDAGLLRGVNEGSVVEFHTEGLHNPTPATLLASGVVQAADAVYSDVKLDDPDFDASSLLESSAFVTNAAFGWLEIGVNIVSADSAWVDAINEYLETIKVVDPSSTSPVALNLVDNRGDDGNVRLVDPTDDHVIKTFSGDLSTLQDAIGKALQSYAKNRFLRRLELASRGIAGSLDILRCEARCERDLLTGEMKCECEALTVLNPDEDGENHLEIAVGERYKFRIRNTGTKSTHTYLLAMLSNGEIHQLYPEDNSQGQKLARNGQHDVDTIFRMAPPLGTDVLMLVSSLSPIDFWPVVTGDESLSKAGRDPFDLLMEDSFHGHRGPEPVFPLGTVSTNLTVIRVVDPSIEPSIE